MMGFILTMLIGYVIISIWYNIREENRTKEWFE